MGRSRFMTWKARSALSIHITLPTSAAYDSYGSDCVHLTFRICLQEKPCNICRCKSRSREVLWLSDHTKQAEFSLPASDYFYSSSTYIYTWAKTSKPWFRYWPFGVPAYYVTSGSDWLSPLKSCWLCMSEDGARRELSCERNKMAFLGSSKENTRQKGSRDYIISRMSLLWLPKGVIF